MLAVPVLEKVLGCTAADLCCQGGSLVSFAVLAAAAAAAANFMDFVGPGQTDVTLWVNLLWTLSSKELHGCVA